jgi:hypothetical protein
MTVSTEKIPGMFATLVLSLPSAHSGGDVIVTHRDQRRIFKTSEHPGSSTYLAWYADVRHEVTPMMAGYRWVLTSNLAVEAPVPRPSAALLNDAIAPDTGPLVDALRRWLHALQFNEPHLVSRGHRVPWYAVYGLDHQYTEANVSFRGLKTRDAVVVQCLQQAETEVPIDVFLAVLEQQKMGTRQFNYNAYDRNRYGYRRGYDDYESDYNDSGSIVDDSGFHVLEDVHDVRRSVRMLALPDGENIYIESPDSSSWDPWGEEENGSELPSNSLLQDADTIYGNRPENEDYEGYMGNSGPEATHWYRASALVIVPRHLTVKFLGAQDADVAVTYCVDRILHSGGDVEG